MLREYLADGPRGDSASGMFLGGKPDRSATMTGPFGVGGLRHDCCFHLRLPQVARTFPVALVAGRIGDEESKIGTFFEFPDDRSQWARLRGLHKTVEGAFRAQSERIAPVRTPWPAITRHGEANFFLSTSPFLANFFSILLNPVDIIV